MTITMPAERITTVTDLRKVTSYRVFMPVQKNRLKSLYPFLSKDQISRKVRYMWNCMSNEKKGDYQKTIVSKPKRSRLSKTYCDSKQSFDSSQTSLEITKANYLKCRKHLMKNDYGDKQKNTFFKGELFHEEYNSPNHDTVAIQHVFPSIKCYRSTDTAGVPWDSPGFTNSQRTYDNSKNNNYLLSSTVPTEVLDETPGKQSGILKCDRESELQKRDTRVSFTNNDVCITIVSPSSSDHSSSNKDEYCVSERLPNRRTKIARKVLCQSDENFCPDFEEIDKFEILTSVDNNNDNHQDDTNVISAEVSQKTDHECRVTVHPGVTAIPRAVRKSSRLINRMSNPEENIVTPNIYNTAVDNRATPEFSRDVNQYCERSVILDNKTYRQFLPYACGNGQDGNVQEKHKAPTVNSKCDVSASGKNPNVTRDKSKHKSLKIPSECSVKPDEFNCGTANTRTKSKIVKPGIVDCGKPNTRTKSKIVKPGIIDCRKPNTLTKSKIVKPGRPNTRTKSKIVKPGIIVDCPNPNTRTKSKIVNAGIVDCGKPDTRTKSKGIIDYGKSNMHTKSKIKADLGYCETHHTCSKSKIPREIQRKNPVIAKDSPPPKKNNRKTTGSLLKKDGRTKDTFMDIIQDVKLKSSKIRATNNIMMRNKNGINDNSQAVLDKVIQEMKAPLSPNSTVLDPYSKLSPNSSKCKFDVDMHDDWIDVIPTSPAKAHVDTALTPILNEPAEGMLCNLFSVSTPHVSSSKTRRSDLYKTLLNVDAFV